METATARFSSTTGDGVSLRERFVERDDAWPVGFFRRARTRVTSGDGGLKGVGARRVAEFFGAFERGETTTDEELIPTRARLDRAKGWVHRTGRRGRASATPEFPSARRGHGLRVPSGASSASMRPRRSASSQSAGRHPVVAAVAE